MEIQNRERKTEESEREGPRENAEREAVSLSRVTSSSDCDAIYMMDD